MTEDAAIRIDCDSTEFVHVPHTWSSSFAQNPRNLSHRILGTSPPSSELDISNETDMPCVPLTASPTCFASHSLGSPVSSRHCHRMAPTIAWPINLSQTGTGSQNNTSCQDYCRYLIRVTAARSLPSLVNTRKRRPPVDRIKAFPHRQMLLH